MAPSRLRFVNYIVWNDIPPNLGTFIHEPDTVGGWNTSLTPSDHDELSSPSTSGRYLGTVDRTISFRAQDDGVVGDSILPVFYEIVNEEVWNYTIDIGQDYIPGDSVRCIFTNQTGDTLDLGLNVHFTMGKVDSQGVFVVGMEDFEGFHVWRGIEPDGRDLTILGEMSKQEEFVAAPFDSLYFSEIIPALRETGRYTLPINVPGLGNTIDITDILPGGRLGANQFMWFDLNPFNGFTYFYTTTTFDRGYNVRSSSQGLNKTSNCPHTQGVEYVCRSYLVQEVTEVSSQGDFNLIYAVPNPFRSGSSQFSTESYHNFPDGNLRIVNVPPQCKLQIFTTAGDLVWNIDHNSTSGNIEWDTRNNSGEEVSSGVYIYRIEIPNGEGMFGRIVIIR
jgi:hypothetical protein